MTWHIIHIIDIILWIITAGSVGYVMLFALMSLFRKKQLKTYENTHSAHSRFAVIYPAYNEDSVIRNSIEIFLHQDYPISLFHLVVVSDHMQPSTNEWLASQPLQLLKPVFEKSSKAKALQYAIKQLEGLDFSHIVILDADNVVDSNFLTKLDSVCQQGYNAIQCHRTAKNSDNDVSALDGLSEEINNTIFRRAHNNIGLSSALIGSGMCFDYQWFATHVNMLSTAVEDRELETFLAKQNIYVKYVEDILVYDEKVSNKDNFQSQRMRWMTGQIQALLQMLPYLFTALIKGNINYIDKTIQQALIPRSILLATIPFMALIMTIVHPLWSIKWWAMLLCLCISLLIAIPSRLRTTAMFRKLLSFPSLVWRLLKNIAHMDHKNTDFIHTSHEK